ncbi:MAG: hypothetical protein ACRENJ_02065 [Candidatus Eiseniibacteriota bacterium]
MTQASLDRGRTAEREVARRLTAWGQPFYTFRRRGLGHAGVADLVVTPREGMPAWPWTISIKARARRAPTLATMFHAAAAGTPWAWWQEAIASVPPERVWLIWKVAGGTWLLSCDGLWGVATPVRLALLPPPPGWPRFTLWLNELLSTVPVIAMLESIRTLDETLAPALLPGPRHG